MKDDMKKNPITLCSVSLGICLWLMGIEVATARDFRITQMPNGAQLGCMACHTSPAGGAARNAFGQAVFVAIGGSPTPKPFWSAALAAQDSDGDGFCNGQEVGDPEGDGAAVVGAIVTNPGLSSSKPANSKPVITSTPSLQVTPGTLYEYQVTARDADACQRLTFSKISGPAWINVSATGLVSGTPPQGINGDFPVTVAVADNGSPAQSAQQTYTLTAAAPASPFAAWQNAHFTLPAEASLAGPLEDPDGDGVVNLLEYAYRLDPRVPGVLAQPTPFFNDNQQMRLSVNIRDDDPKLSVRMVVGESALLAASSAVEGSVSDPTPGDGWKTWTFEDPVIRTNAVARFARIVIELLP